jgi:prevent-host-death family protein
MLMDTYSLTEARANLPLLLNRAENGEELTITRHGRPVGVIVGHTRWMKTARYEVLELARKLHDDLEERRSKPFPGWRNDLDYDVEGHIAWLRENDDPWDEIERGEA